jgi:hypothetical protein
MLVKHEANYIRTGRGKALILLYRKHQVGFVLLVLVFAIVDHLTYLGTVPGTLGKLNKKTTC